MEIPREPDNKRLFAQFRKVGMDADGACLAVQEIRTMAGQNLIARLDVQEAKWDLNSEDRRSGHRRRCQATS